MISAHKEGGVGRRRVIEGHGIASCPLLEAPCVESGCQHGWASGCGLGETGFLQKGWELLGVSF